MRRNQTDLLNSKMKLMLSWATLFFHEEHRAAFAYIAHKRIDGIERVNSKDDAIFWKSKNIDNILA